MHKKYITRIRFNGNPEHKYTLEKEKNPEKKINLLNPYQLSPAPGVRANCFWHNRIKLKSML